MAWPTSSCRWRSVLLAKPTARLTVASTAAGVAAAGAAWHSRQAAVGRRPVARACAAAISSGFSVSISLPQVSLMQAMHVMIRQAAVGPRGRAVRRAQALLACIPNELLESLLQALHGLSDRQLLVAGGVLWHVHMLAF